MQLEFERPRVEYMKNGVEFCIYEANVVYADIQISNKNKNVS